MKDGWKLAYEVNGTNCVTSLLIKGSDTFQLPQRGKLGTLWTCHQILNEQKRQISFIANTL